MARLILTPSFSRPGCWLPFLIPLRNGVSNNERAHQSPGRTKQHGYFCSSAIPLSVSPFCGNKASAAWYQLIAPAVSFSFERA